MARAGLQQPRGSRSRNRISTGFLESKEYTGAPWPPPAGGEIDGVTYGPVEFLGEQPTSGGGGPVRAKSSETKASDTAKS